jgi:hypothetical protein
VSGGLRDGGRGLSDGRARPSWTAETPGELSRGWPGDEMDKILWSPFLAQQGSMLALDSAVRDGPPYRLTVAVGKSCQRSVKTRSGNPRAFVSWIFFSSGLRIARRRSIVSRSIQPFSQEGNTAVTTG